MGIVGVVGMGLTRSWPAAFYSTVAGGLRDRIRLHAVGDSAVHPDGQLRRPRRPGARAVPRRLRLHRPSARRPGARHHRGLRRLRRHLRLVDRHRRDDEQGGLPVDAEARLQRVAVDRRHGRRRHAGHHDPAFDHHGDLRHRDRDQHRQAVRRRRHSRPADGTGDDGGHRRRDLARPGACTAGRALHLARALGRRARHLGRAAAGDRRARRHLRRRVHRHRRRRHRRLRRLPVRAGAPRADLEGRCSRSWSNRRAPRRCCSRC